MTTEAGAAVDAVAVSAVVGGGTGVDMIVAVVADIVDTGHAVVVVVESRSHSHLI